MRTAVSVVAACLLACAVHGQKAPGPRAEFHGHILPGDRDFKLTLMEDRSASAEWIGSAGRRYDFGGSYTESAGSYEVMLKARDTEQFYQSLNLSIKPENGLHSAVWTSERQKASRPVAELRLALPGAREPTGRVRAGTQKKEGKPVVGLIRTGARARTSSARQTASAKRITNRSFRTASRRIVRAARRTNRRK